MSKVEIIQVNEMMKDWPEKWASDVEIELKNGKKFRKYVAYPKGDKNNPMDRDEVIGKFKELCSSRLRQETIEEVVEMIFKIETLINIETLMKKLGVTNN